MQVRALASQDLVTLSTCEYLGVLVSRGAGVVQVDPPDGLRLGRRQPTHRGQPPASSHAALRDQAGHLELEDPKILRAILKVSDREG